MSGLMDGLGQKIAAARDLNGVVRSMKALAASSIGQYEKAVAALHDYHRTVELGLSLCIARMLSASGVPAHAPTDSIGVVIFGSDQGLVGRFNEVLIEFSLRELNAIPGKGRKFWAVGERMRDLATEAGLLISGTLAVPNSVAAITQLVAQVLLAVETAREHGDIGSIYVFHNAPTASSHFEPTMRRLLPLEDHQRQAAALHAWPTQYVPQIIDEIGTTFEAFVREHFFILLFRACAESLASENASRLQAMQRAEKNIEEILDDLNRTFHRLRQERIDGDMFDVIAGYQSLSGPSSSAPGIIG
jgi:F-type H+-transporting ATPase subunit gamma